MAAKNNSNVETMVSNFEETLNNLAKSIDDLTEEQVVEIGKQLHDRLFRPSNPPMDWDEADVSNLMDNVQLIVLLASGIPTCTRCARPANNGCDCGDEANVVDLN